MSGEPSSFAKAPLALVDFLRDAGAAGEGLHLPDHGVRGSGHGLIYEKNYDEALRLVLRCLAARRPATADRW